MPKESFLYSETKPVFDLIEETSRRSGVSRAQAFEDFLLMSVAALSGGQLEDQYMATVKKHAEGKPGKRGCDSIAQAFGTLVDAMEKTRHDILGDLFQGSISYGEAGQFLTPESICQMLARLTVSDLTEEEQKTRKSVYDPCVGSGRMLLAVAEICPHWDYIGCDIDLRCVRMTAINLALRNLYGYVIWGNSLGVEKRMIYRTGFNLRGVIREIPLEECPAPVRQAASELTEPMATGDKLDAPPKPDDEIPQSGKQLRLF